jgi:hypothetical protein
MKTGGVLTKKNVVLIPDQKPVTQFVKCRSCHREYKKTDQHVVASGKKGVIILILNCSCGVNTILD